jgi:hypothetical protein
MSKRANAKKQQTLFNYFKVQDKDTVQNQTECPVSNSLEMLSIGKSTVDIEEEEGEEEYVQGKLLENKLFIPTRYYQID